jgi:hypothetical protein
MVLANVMPDALSDPPTRWLVKARVLWAHVVGELLRCSLYEPGEQALSGSVAGGFERGTQKPPRSS